MRLFLSMLIVAGLAACVAAQSRLGRGRVVFPDGTVVQVEVADTPSALERGLMFRASLGANEGMIFVFPKAGFYPFWMKNTLIPLDMLWLDAGGRVVSVATGVPPCKADPCPSYPPEADASYVVEVAAGTVRAHGLKKGDTLKLEAIRPAR